MSDSKKLAELKSRLAKFIYEKSYREGDFVLASGKKSSFYIDLKATTLHPEGASLIGACAVASVEEKGWVLEGVGGLTLGADPIATSVSLAAFQRGWIWPAFIVRKEAKAHGTSRYIEGVENLRPGARLLVVEDVTTTGGSSLKAVERLRRAGYSPRGVLTIVDRQQGAREAFNQVGIELEALLTLADIQAVKAPA